MGCSPVPNPSAAPLWARCLEPEGGDISCWRHILMGTPTSWFHWVAKNPGTARELCWSCLSMHKEETHLPHNCFCASLPGGSHWEPTTFFRGSKAHLVPLYLGICSEPLEGGLMVRKWVMCLKAAPSWVPWVGHPISRATLKNYGLAGTI